MRIIKIAFTLILIFSFFVIGSFFVLADEQEESEGNNNLGSGDNFPVDEAGIAAYVKLDVPSDQMYKVLTDALNYYSNKEAPETNQYYVVGAVEVDNEVPYYKWKDYPHLYVGLDGWMVAYYLKDQEVSRIMQWKNYTPGEISTTTLKDAIDQMCQNLGVSYSGEIKYYDFAYPQATKMTLVAETVPSGQNQASNSFSVIIPGTLYEASYITHMHCGYSHCLMELTVDGKPVISKTSSADKSGDFLDYGSYSPVVEIEANVPHLIKFTSGFWGGEEATVFIY